MALVWVTAILTTLVATIHSQQSTPSLIVPKLNISGSEHLICFLRREPPEICSNITIDVNQIPLRLGQLYQRMGKKLKEYIMKGSLAYAPPETFSELHQVIFYLMPNGDKRLRATGHALARILRAQGGDPASIIVTVSLLHSHRERDYFLSQLAGVNLSERSQMVLGEYLVQWFKEGENDWKFDRFSKVLRAGNPLVGSLPSPFLTSLDQILTEKFIFLLSHWESQGTTREEQWYSKGKKVMRTWATMVMESKYPHILSNWTATSYNRYPFLLLGFTADELLNMSIPNKDARENILKMKFDKLQARAVFEVIMKEGTELKASNLKNGIPIYTAPILTLLSPHQLLFYFNHSIADFGLLNYPSEKYFPEPSLATAKQLAHCLMAQSILRRLKNSTSEQNDSKATDIASATNLPTLPLLPKLNEATAEDFLKMGRFAYSLKLSYFIKRNISELSIWQLQLLNSDHLSPRQARFLMQNSTIHLENNAHGSENKTKLNVISANDIPGLGSGLLRGLFTSSSITALNTRMIPQIVLKHLLKFYKPWKLENSLEEDESLLPLAIIEMIRNELDQDWVLKNILSHADSAQLLKYLTSREITTISQSIIKIASFVTLSGLHPITLSILMDAAMPELKLRGSGTGQWTSDSLTYGTTPLLRGLKCSHLSLLDPHDVVVVLGQFNKQRQAKQGIKYLRFPKNLQKCALRALAQHLKAKSAVWDERGKEFTISNYELLLVLEDSDIEAVGGYVIAGLPKGVLTFLGADAVRLIGQLSPHELLSSLYGNHHPTDIAHLLLIQLGLNLNNGLNSNITNGGSEGKTESRLADKWLRWNEREKSLMPVLFGSLFTFLPPNVVDPASLRWALETGNVGDNRLCLDSKNRGLWYSVLLEAFGAPNFWTASILATIADFLIVVPSEMLESVPIKSWTNAADSLIEKSRYLAKDVEMPMGLESYTQACTKFLPKSERESYLEAVKRLARYYLVAIQMQLNQVISFMDLVRNDTMESKKGRFSDGRLVHVPGLKKLSQFKNTSKEDKGLPQQERTKAKITSTASKWSPDIKITCEALRAAGPGIAGASLNSQDIELMSSQEIWECIDVIGTFDLYDDVLRKLWTRIKNQTELVLEIQDLGKIVGAMLDDDLTSFNVSIDSDLDSVLVLGKELRSWDLANKWALKVLPKQLDAPMNVKTVAAMGGLLCGLSEATLKRTLMPYVIIRAAPLLISSLSTTKTKGCPPVQCLKILGKLAADGLGELSDGWSETDFAAIGILAAGLPKEVWNELNERGLDSPINGLQTSAFQCLPDTVIKELSTHLISQMPLSVAMSLTEKRNLLTEEQISALEKVISTPFDYMIFPSDYNTISHTNVKDIDIDENLQGAAESGQRYHIMIIFSCSLSLILMR